MSTIFKLITYFLCVAVVVFSYEYIQLNKEDAPDKFKNKILLWTLWGSQFSTLLFAALTCLLADPGKIDKALTRASHLYGFIAICWGVVIVMGFVSLIRTLITSRFYETTAKAYLLTFFIAFLGLLLGGSLSWLIG
ncbi:MAG: hypothetical protein IK077_14055 [Thermoguttaceae bacterium]|nr:hypothetical protein [Thermoguttaceae bacterium]